MAESTEKIVTVSWWQLYLATAGTVLVFASLGLAFYSTFQARKAVQAAERQADVAEKALKNIERPYLFLEVTSQHNLANPGRGEMPSLNYKITNYGKMPAIFKSLYLELLPMDDVSFLPDGAPRLWIGTKDWFIVLPTNESTGERGLYVMGSQPDQRIAPELPLALHCRLVYEDPTDALHTHHFLMVREHGRFVRSYSKRSTAYPEDHKPRVPA